MKIAAFILALLIGGVASSRAVELKTEPDYRFAWNQFTAVATVDSIAILAGPQGIVAAVYDKNIDKFKSASQTLSIDHPSRIIVGDSVVAVILENLRVCLLDKFALPQLVVRGYADLPDSTQDLVFWRQHIFFASGFRGLLHARLIDSEQFGPLDSAQEGVHIVSLSIQGDRLLAIDDYNGLLEYQIDPSGSPKFVSQLNLPFQATDVAQAGDTALIARTEQDSLVVAVRTPTGWSAPKLLETPFGCQYVFVMDTFVVVISRDLVGFSVFTRRSLSFINSFTNYSGKSLVYPVAFRVSRLTRMLLPGQSGGLLQYWMAQFDQDYLPNEAYFPSSAVNVLAFAGKWLVAGGMWGWCHAYDCGLSPVPDTEITIYDQFGIIAKVLATNQGVAILNSTLGKVNLTKDEGQGPRPFATFFLGHSAANMFWGRKSIANSAPVVFWSGSELYLYRFSGAIEMPYTAQLKVPIGIRSAAIVDSLLVLSVAKNGLWVYQITPDYKLEYCGALSVTDEINLLVDIPSWPSCLAGIRSNELSKISFANRYSPHLDTTITLPLTVTDASHSGSLLYTIGPESTAVWTMASDGSLPVLAGVTPTGGFSVAGNGTVMATTDGKAIYTFDLRGPTDVDQPEDLLPVTSTLLVNYPNPFNPSTIVAYAISSPGEITLTIFNSLGQRVRELERIHRTPGQYRVEWNGRDDHNLPVASGTYFCRLISRDGARTGKMMLVR